MSDVFAFALDLEDERFRPAIHETPAGRAEADRVLGADGRGFLAVQALTSDKKKNWDMRRFEQALALFSAVEPTAQVVFLGAEYERTQLAPVVDGLRARGVDARLAISSVEGLFSIVKRARLVLTGDTATKHFAAAARTPSVELSLGSSDWRRTGAYADDSVVVQARELCAPCPHVGPCRQPSHACAERISPEAVSSVLTAAYRRDWAQMSVAAVEFSDEVDVLRVRLRTPGLFTTVSAAGAPNAETAANVLARVAWKMRLSGASGTNDGLLPYGSNAQKILAATDGSLEIFDRLEARAGRRLELLRLHAQRGAEAALRAVRDDLAQEADSLALARIQL